MMKFAANLRAIAALGGLLVGWETEGAVAPVLRLKFGFEDPAGPVAVNGAGNPDPGAGSSTTLQMFNFEGAPTDYRGAPGSGVGEGNRLGGAYIDAPGGRR